MNEIFLTVLNMSLRASYVILFVILVRLLLRKAPKVISYALWGVVAFRLVIPFSFESIFSLMPRNTNIVQIPGDIVYQQSPQIYSEIKTATSYLSRSLPTPVVSTSANQLQLILQAVMKTGPYVWFTGIIVLLAYSLISVLLIKRQLKAARLIENNIYEADNLKTPFVFGIIRPKIYLPFGLDSGERSFILLHEQTHIQRKDNLVKILAFLIVTIHWFNPLVWIAFMLMGTDMELSCDEKVLKLIKEDIKKSYADSLLSLATGRHILNGSPLAFGEGNVKRRIKNVLNYKKPGFWVIFLSIIIAAAITIGLATNPKSSSSFTGSTYRVKEILYQKPSLSSFLYTLDNVPQYSISPNLRLYIKETDDEEWKNQGDLNRYEISKEELMSLFSPTRKYNFSEAISKTKLIYRADIPDSEYFYLVIQLKNGNVLLATGHDYSKDNRYIDMLFKLERQSKFDDAELITYSNGIRWDMVGDVPQPVRDYAIDYVSEQIEYCNSLGYNIADAKITKMISMNTGTASETMSIELWLLEYRLKLENAEKVVLAGGMQIEDGWLTEWSSMGQPYLLLECRYTKDMEEIWQPICVTYTDEIESNYATPEMLDKYGNKFTAAAMELYEINRKNLNNTISPWWEEEQKPILELPHLTPDMSVGVEVIPDYIDDSKLIFHGYFGLFVYDLNAEKITLAVDIGKAVGTTQIQGSEGAAVRVKEDGTLIQLYSYSEQGNSEMAYYIDPITGDCSYDKYRPISDAFSLPADFYGRFKGATLGELTYTDGEKSWLIFKDWDWAK